MLRQPAKEHRPGNCLPSHAHDGARRSVALRAPAIAAPTGNAIRLDGHVAKLARHTVHASPDFSVQHNAAANSGAQCNHRHIRHAPCRSQPLLAQRRHVRVVIEHHARIFAKQPASPQSALNRRPHRIILPPRKIRRLPHLPRLRVDNPQHPNPSSKKFPRLPMRAETRSIAEHISSMVRSGPRAVRVGTFTFSRSWPSRLTAATRRLVPPRSTPMEKSGMKQ